MIALCRTLMLVLCGVMIDCANGSVTKRDIISVKY
jgi:hypothetical protein